MSEPVFLNGMTAAEFYTFGENPFAFSDSTARARTIAAYRKRVEAPRLALLQKATEILVDRAESWWFFNGVNGKIGRVGKNIGKFAAVLSMFVAASSFAERPTSVERTATGFGTETVSPDMQEVQEAQEAGHRAGPIAQTADIVAVEYHATAQDGAEYEISGVDGSSLFTDDLSFDTVSSFTTLQVSTEFHYDGTEWDTSGLDPR